MSNKKHNNTYDIAFIYKFQWDYVLFIFDG